MPSAEECLVSLSQSVSHSHVTSRGRSCANLNKRYLTVTVEVVRPRPSVRVRPSASLLSCHLQGAQLGKGEKGKWRGERDACTGILECESRYSDIPSEVSEPIISLIRIRTWGTFYCTRMDETVALKMTLITQGEEEEAQKTQKTVY